MEFDEIVNRDIRRNSTVEEQVFLRSPENLENWHNELLRLQEKIRRQVERRDERLAQAAKDFAEKSISSNELAHILDGDKVWRLKLNTFSSVLAERIEECEQLIAKQVNLREILSNAGDVLEMALNRESGWEERANQILNELERIGA